MAVFELTARHQMYLGAGNQINKGERLTMNIHTMGVQPYNIFSNPESRRQAIQQFSVNGIDVSSREYLLNTGHWDIKRVPDSFSNDGYPEILLFQWLFQPLPLKSHIHPVVCGLLFHIWFLSLSELLLPDPFHRSPVFEPFLPIHSPVSLW